MIKAKPSQGKWIAGPDHLNEPEGRWAVYSAENGGVVASDCYKEDARDIVHHANCHEGLLEALQIMLKRAEASGWSEPLTRIATEAIAKARSEKELAV
jgi:hypothetical protein